MKQIIITALLAYIAMAGQAKNFKTIKTPEAMACVNVRNGELKAREVILTTLQQQCTSRWNTRRDRVSVLSRRVT